MVSKTFWQVVAILLLLGLIFGGGYYLGYKSVSVTERVVEKLVPGDTIRDSIRFPVPVYVDRWHPGKVDTVYFPSPTSPIDSASVVEDYFATRDYLLDFSTDSCGTFKVSCKVTRNQLVDASSTIVPMYRYIENVREVHTTRFFQPWAMVGTDFRFGTQQLMLGGDFREKYKVGVSGIRIGDNYGWTLNVGFNF